eukprot:TRINITY_DN24659_c0_g1_i1.p1 TRINITY_DN24659_c0_g1~~TRINITY_DN24659_c0_g1_i1.p1  ORF type:complete len:325 (-),score=41.30 TRINITY_DN24659_c0_g1_i1:30-1004(-)
MEPISRMISQQSESSPSFLARMCTSVRQTMIASADKSTWSTLRIKCDDFLHHTAVEIGTCLIVVLNLVLVILETDAEAAQKPQVWMDYASKCFLFVYTLELGLKFYTQRCMFFESRWNWLDFGVVSLDLTALAVALVIDMPSFAILRVLRLARLGRAFKAIKMFGELNKLLRGFVSAIKALFWGILMITMLLIVWGIMAVNVLHPVNQVLVEKDPHIYEGCDRCARAYSSVFDSMLTIFQQVVAGDSWGLVSLQIIEEEPSSALFFLGVLVTINLVMLNLILSVIVEAAVASAALDEEEHREEIKKEQVSCLCCVCVFCVCVHV